MSAPAATCSSGWLYALKGYNCKRCENSTFSVHLSACCGGCCAAPAALCVRTGLCWRHLVSIVPQHSWCPDATQEKAPEHASLHIPVNARCVRCLLTRGSFRCNRSVRLDAPHSACCLPAQSLQCAAHTVLVLAAQAAGVAVAETQCSASVVAHCSADVLPFRQACVWMIASRGVVGTAQQRRVATQQRKILGGAQGNR